MVLMKNKVASALRWLDSIHYASSHSGSYKPMQLVAPSAVIIAVAILAIICKINFAVSFLLIVTFRFLVHTSC